jgi:hypothetical protein
MADVPENLVAYVNRAMQEFEANILKVATEEASAADQTAAKAIATGKSGPGGFATVTPAIAAVLLCEHNQWNRDLSLAKVRHLAGSMTRGEWQETHQGVAFYDDENIADGQHRFAAVFLSGITQRFTVFRGLKRKSLEAIDQVAKRTAGDAMQMRGFENGRLAASIAAQLIKYEDMRLLLKLTTPSIYQIEQWSADHAKQIHDGIGITKALIDPRGEADDVGRVSALVLSEAENATIATGMLIGGYENVFVRLFLLGVHSGLVTQDYPLAPTSWLHKDFAKAQKSDRTKDHLSKEEKMAMSFKAARLFYQHRGASSPVRWTKGKEKLPAPTPYDAEEEAYAAE